MHRRHFLKSASVGALALSSGGWLTRAQGSPNSQIHLGIIGAGDRGQYLLGEILDLAARHNATVTAICDVWQVNRQAAAAKVKAKLGTEPKTFTRFGDLLADSTIDAVTIATPDFSHGTILVAALKAGKDVYIEKPMTIDLASANEALDLARKKRRVVQAGTQRRSDGKFLGAARLVATGVLGPVSRVSAAVFFNENRWARPTDNCRAEAVDWDAYLLHLPKRPFDAKLLRRWQLYRETSNGLPGLWMTHYADAVHLVTGARYPARAVALGNRYVWKEGRQHTDTFQTLLDYPEGFLFAWAMGLANSAGTHFTVHGTKGTLDLEKWTLSPEGGKDSTIQPQPVKAEPDQSHMGNWLTCLRSRQAPNADIQYGHQHVVATVMAARALETGRRQHYDPDKRTISNG